MDEHTQPPGACMCACVCGSRAVEYNVYGINMFIIKSAVTRLSAVRCL